MRTAQPWLLMAAFALLPSLEAAAQAIAWHTDLERARQAAAQQHRLLLVHFWAPSCGPCMAMEKTVFNQRQVGEVVHANYVPVKLNVDDWQTTARQLGITSIPADVVMEPSGKVLARFNSPATPQAYMAAMGQIAESARRNGQAALASYGQQNEQPAPARGDATGAADRWGSPMGSMPPGYPQPEPNAQATGSANGSPYNSLGATAPGGPPPSDPRASSAPSAQQPDGQGWMGSSPGFAARNDSLGGGLSSARPPAWQQPAPSVAQRDASRRRGQDPFAGRQGAPANDPRRQVGDEPPLGAGIHPPLALEGYCPVSLVSQQRIPDASQRQWVVGDRRWGATHEGRTYLFAGPEEQREFLERPWIYAPAFGGDDPVLLVDQRRNIPGKREHGLYFKGRIYLFSEEGTLQHFLRDPRPYIEPEPHTGRPSTGGQFR